MGNWHHCTKRIVLTDVSTFQCYSHGNDGLLKYLSYNRQIMQWVLPSGGEKQNNWESLRELERVHGVGELNEWGFWWYSKSPSLLFMNGWGTGRVLPYLGMVERWSLRFSIWLGFQFYVSSQSGWSLLSAEKIRLSLSHLVSEIFAPKVGLIFHQNVLTIFKHFVSIDSLFFIELNSFWPHFYKTLDPIGSIFLLHAEPGYWKFGEVPFPLTPGSSWLKLMVPWNNPRWYTPKES